MAPRLPNYVFEPLDSVSQDIRVLQFLPDENGTISLELMHVRPTYRYRCLSYCWGSRNPSQDRRILINGRRFLVRSNLWAFLNVARRKYPNALFWIDAICIDQSNDVEKGREVKRMGDIYSNAAGVVVWLGNGTYNEELLLAHIRQEHLIKTHRPWQKAPKTRTSALIRDGLSTKIPEILGRICENEYWTRAWIVQEIALGASVVLLQGRQDVSWGSFSWSLYEYGSLLDSPAGHVMRAIKSIKDKSRGSTELVDLLGLFDLGRQNCQENRDKIYSLLSIIEGGRNVDPTYVLPDEEVFFSVLSGLSPRYSFLATSRRLLEILCPEQFGKLAKSAPNLSSGVNEIELPHWRSEDKLFFTVRSRQCQGPCRRKRWAHLAEHEECWEWLEKWHEVCSNCAATEHFAENSLFDRDLLLTSEKPESVRVMTLGRPFGRPAPGHFLFVRSELDAVWRCRGFIARNTTFSDRSLLHGITLSEEAKVEWGWGRPLLDVTISFSRVGFLSFLLMTWDNKSRWYGFEYFSWSEDMKMY